ncbi:hypothetical protein IMSHALPRED_008734 [Imshaugia aleurites]|uniref:DNA-directed RNA polymerase II subunit RPB9-like zinc ribbon domain-containing protein n=1 Tax=Imshaugia aleurites TaxID=172621 RepID=A0A8H3G2E5_9LECA|nr:hypothetical protein IMSHALPRED_008734 [Imshaugia aleurites]
MASPSPASASADTPPAKIQEQITFRFCRECSNMLYPKEDRATNKLMFACRTCQFSEEAISSCVYRNTMYNTVGETAGVTQDVGSDPTVEGWGKAKAKGEERGGANVVVFDLSEMDEMDDGDEEMDGEPDTTNDDEELSSHYGGEQKSAVQRASHIPHTQGARLPT